MRNLSPFLIFFILLLTACEKDKSSTNLLNYDSDNVTAPEFLPGDYEMAARFTTSETGAFQGQFLEEVQVYLVERPSRTEIVIYDEGTNSSPGAILHSQVVSTEVRPNSWNTILLDTPIEIQNKDLWISFKVRHRDPYGTVGCDIGPANDNGDKLFTTADGWTTLRGFTNQGININWNIRGVLGD